MWTNHPISSPRPDLSHPIRAGSLWDMRTSHRSNNISCAIQDFQRTTNQHRDNRPEKLLPHLFIALMMS